MQPKMAIESGSDEERPPTALIGLERKRRMVCRCGCGKGGKVLRYRSRLWVSGTVLICQGKIAVSAPPSNKGTSPPSLSHKSRQCLFPRLQSISAVQTREFGKISRIGAAWSFDTLRAGMHAF